MFQRIVEHAEEVDASEFCGVDWELLAALQARHFTARCILELVQIQMQIY